MTSKSGHEVNPASWIRRKCPINVRYYGNWPIQRISTQFVSALHLEPIKKEIWLVLFWQIFIFQITHRIGRWTGAKIIFRLGHGPTEGMLELKTPLWQNNDINYFENHLDRKSDRLKRLEKNIFCNFEWLKLNFEMNLFKIKIF